MDAWDTPVPDGLLDGTGYDEPEPRRAPVAEPRQHPYQAELDYLRELGARLHTSGSTGEPTARPVLDAGRFGLEFFRRFGPAYAAATGREVDTALERRYDEHQEVDYRRLRADVQRHQEVAAALDERILDIRNGASPVFEAWQGEAAGQAKGRFDAFLAKAGQVRAQFTDLAGVLAAAVDAVDRAVHEKASGVADLWTDRVGTLTAADLAFVIDFGRRCGAPEPGPLVDDDELRRVAGFCGIEVNPVLCRLNPEVFGQVAADVRGWLDSVFVPFYRARADAAGTICAAADTVIAGAWQAVTAMLDDVSPDAFHGVFAEAPTPVSQASTPVTAPTAAADVVSDEPLPDTPADRPGGITSALDGTAPDPTGSSDNAPQTMQPSAGPAPVAGPVPAAPSATGGAQQSTTFFGTPFLGGLGANRGGGDAEHKRGVALTGPPAEDPPPAQPRPVIGGAGDAGLYNQDAVDAAGKPKSLLEELDEESR